MVHRKRVAALILSLAALAMAGGNQSGQVVYETENGVIRVRNYATSSVVPGERLTLKISGGTPAVVEDTGRGLTLTGRDITLVLQSTSERRYEIQSATVTGGATVLLDEEAAYRTALTRDAKTAKPTDFTRTRFESASVHYLREGEEGVLTVPEAIRTVAETEGIAEERSGNATQKIPFNQQVTMSGSKGRFTIFAPSDGEFRGRLAPKSALIEGPVRVHLTRTERRPDAKMAGQLVADVTDITATADKMEAQHRPLQGSTLTATGNIRIQGTGRGAPGQVTGEQVIITLDAGHRPTEYVFTGTPTTAKVGFGGGRR